MEWRVELVRFAGTVLAGLCSMPIITSTTATYKRKSPKPRTPTTRPTHPTTSYARFPNRTRSSVASVLRLASLTRCGGRLRAEWLLIRRTTKARVCVGRSRTRLSWQLCIGGRRPPNSGPHDIRITARRSKQRAAHTFPQICGCVIKKGSPHVRRPCLRRGGGIW